MTIGEFSEKCGISPSALRYYEKKGLIRVTRDCAGRREYDSGDIAWVSFLVRLKSTGMPLREIKQYSDLRYKGNSTVPERLEILLKHKEYVDIQRKQWDEYAENLCRKIEVYKNMIDMKK